MEQRRFRPRPALHVNMKIYQQKKGLNNWCDMPVVHGQRGYAILFFPQAPSYIRDYKELLKISLYAVS